MSGCSTSWQGGWGQSRSITALQVGARGAKEAVELATRTTDAQDGHAHAMHIYYSTAILLPSPDPHGGASSGGHNEQRAGTARAPRSRRAKFQTDSN